jgi:uncharacterized membrane protein
MTRFRIGHYLKTSLYVVPLLFVLCGIALSLLATAVDDGSLVPESVSGDPHAALQILYLISFAMLTLTGLVLSLLVVAVQLAMGTFSPRIVRQILQDRPSQCAIGLFAGTFTFSLLAMRTVKTTDDGGTVPGLAVIIAIVLVILCMATLVWYLNHIAQSLRTAALVEWVAGDTATALDRLYPDEGRAPVLAADLIPAPRSGVVFMIGYDGLVAMAQRADCRLELLWGVGDFVPFGSPLVRIAGEPGNLSRTDVVRAIALGPERTLNEDVAYGIRMLVDIAERTISSGPFEDPTTTVQAIDRLHDIMRKIAWRPMHSGEYVDAAGTVRVTVPTLQWEGFVRLAFEELRQAGAGSPQVSRRLTAALEDLIDFAPADRRSALERELALLHAQAVRTALSDADGEAALEPDPAGLGSAAALVAPSDADGSRR